MRFSLTLLVFALAVPLSSCGDVGRHSAVVATFVNTTDSLLCFETQRSTAGQCLTQIKPHEKREWEAGCGYSAPDEAFPLTITLSVAADGREIYSRTENCKIWNDAHITLIIKQFQSRFSVIDSLPGMPTPS